MSSVFKSPKIKPVEINDIEPEIVDVSETVFEMEKKRKKKMGAVSQLLSKDNSYGGKTTLGG